MSKSRQKLSDMACNKCGAIGKFKRIIYGLPSDDFDFEKYAVGGCIIEENAPDIQCKVCGAREIRQH